MILRLQVDEGDGVWDTLNTRQCSGLDIERTRAELATLQSLWQSNYFKEKSIQFRIAEEK
jgi:hypothetical protein